MHTALCGIVMCPALCCHLKSELRVFTHSVHTLEYTVTNTVKRESFEHDQPKVIGTATGNNGNVFS